MERAKLLDILHKITLFKDLSDKELNYVLDMPKVYKTFYPGDAIVKEGEKDACFFILLSGSASVFLKDQELAQIFQIHVVVFGPLAKVLEK